MSQGNGVWWDLSIEKRKGRKGRKEGKKMVIFRFFFF
jgi:hypothetical protein